MKTAIVYSCYLFLDWKNIVFDQLNRLFHSDYYKDNGKIYIMAVGSVENLISIKYFIKDKERVEIKYYTNPIYGCESYGFQQIYKLCLEGYNYIGFLHSKGISRPNMPAVVDWRKCMEYFVIDNAHHLINKLNTEDYNCAGVLLDVFGATSNPEVDLIEKYRNFIFPGNFFWVKSDLFLQKKFPEISSDRFYYERYLGSFENVKPYYVFIKKYLSYGDHVSYSEPINENEYI